METGTWLLVSYLKLEEMKLNYGHLGTSGLSTTLGLARIQMYTKVWLESDLDI